MDKADKRAVKSHFERGVKELFPAFRKFTAKEASDAGAALRGGELYGLQLSSELWFYIRLQFDPKYNGDWFDVNVAWSPDGDFPGTPLGPDEEPIECARSFALTKFWEKRTLPSWYLVEAYSIADGSPCPHREAAPDAEHTVEGQCGHCLEMLRKYALPYFKRVARQRGIKSKSVEKLFCPPQKA